MLSRRPSKVRKPLWLREKDGGILVWRGGRDTSYGGIVCDYTTTPGDAEAVLRAFDTFGREEFLMNVGDE